MAVRAIKNSWWVDFRFNHTRYRKRSPENSRAGAQAYEAALRHRLARGEDIDAITPRPAQQQSFAEFAWRWFDDYVVSNNKFSEQRTKQYALSGSLVPFFGKIPVDQISAHHIEQYKAWKAKAGLSNKTINNHLTILSKCLSTAYEWLSIERAPPRIKRLKASPPKTDHLSRDDCALLLAHAKGVVYELILTALRTGMRQGELRGLQWSSVDWDNRILTVRHSWCDLRKVLISPKSNRERHIPLDQDVHDLLARRKKGTGFVFLDTDDVPFDRYRLANRLNAVSKRAGIRRVGWHSLRHTFATNLAMKGTPLNIVQALLGHSTITTTMRYAHVAPSSLRTAIELLNPRAALTSAFGQPVGTQWQERQRLAAMSDDLEPANDEFTPQNDVQKLAA